MATAKFTTSCKQEDLKSSFEHRFKKIRVRGLHRLRRESVDVGLSQKFEEEVGKVVDIDGLIKLLLNEDPEVVNKLLDEWSRVNREAASDPVDESLKDERKQPTESTTGVDIMSPFFCLKCPELAETVAPQSTEYGKVSDPVMFRSNAEVPVKLDVCGLDTELGRTSQCSQSARSCRHGSYGGDRDQLTNLGLRVQVLKALVPTTYDGSLLWKISDIAVNWRYASENRIESFYSPVFYTGSTGYKMCCRLYLNGDGMGVGTHISVFFLLMRGDYDALLKWPFAHNVSLILLDQTHRRHIVQTFKPTPDSSSFQRPVSDENVASGYPQFASLDVLRDDRYVKDDTMFLKCIVDTSKICHP